MLPGYWHIETDAPVPAGADEVPLRQELTHLGGVVGVNAHPLVPHGTLFP